ncbi:MAG: hypothetical protein FJ104_08485 [Deltaproteobacteria bacterium]|nr:hypothetical protein [Deltaproteobacteria bacterium]
MNTNTSDDHCGRCGNPCALDSACYGRTCEKIINARPCGPTETICRDLGCVDLDTNPYACGDCSTICPDNTACVSGKCDPNQCGFGFVLCESTDGSSSAPAECVSLDSSDAHCGRCGNACDATNEHCSEGKCVSSCGALETGCPGSGCVDLASRVDHCGECGKSCHPSTSDQYGWMQCMSGECACPAGTSRCGEDCAEHTFYCAPDTGSDPVELCKARAGSPFERCACDSCFDLLAECTKDPRCVHAVDCGFDNGCPSCPQPYVYECRERNDLLHPVAFKIVECMNSRCGGG